MHVITFLLLLLQRRPERKQARRIKLQKKEKRKRHAFTKMCERQICVVKLPGFLRSWRLGNCRSRIRFLPWLHSIRKPALKNTYIIVSTSSSTRFKKRAKDMRTNPLKCTLRRSKRADRSRKLLATRTANFGTEVRPK